MKFPSRPLAGFSFALALIIFDQISKWAIMEKILRPALEAETTSFSLARWLMEAPERLPPIQVYILPFFNWVMVWNQGISFGILRDGIPWILIGFTALVTLLFSVWLARTHVWPQVISLAMIIGGALGNIIDRIRFGAVADFLDFHAFGYHWPAFNLADSCITVGVAILLFDGVFLDPKRRKDT